jgi:NAD(P)-dependent dehydrogenase (short-subunit alcohol dehydrogenase family)|tara:strand:+ start:4110 stop:4931 length:822 start_codon:yes stop_codon:yes gene_type:complete
MKLSNYKLNKKFCLITGAAGLLGYEHARAILEVEGNVVLTDVNERKLIQIQKKLKNIFSKQKILYYKMDVSNLESIKHVLKKLKKQKIKIKILINNAAIDSKISNKSNFSSNFKFENFSLEMWNKEIQVGLTGAMLCSRVFGNEMKNGGGVILNIASDLSVIAPNQSIYKSKSTKNNNVKPVTYSVIKHGLIGLTKYLATYWPNDKIRCNALSPGGILNKQGKEFLLKVQSQIPMNRLANKSEYKAAVQFLCSDASSYMTGQNLIIDGGRSIW